ncbi:MAG: glycosyltransferase [Hyphomicrobiaceae bacterium]
MATERFEPEKPAQNRVLYLNSNLWFGVKAGGSVGHISGVVNGMHELGIPVEFVAVGGRLLIREAVPYLPLTPPAQFAATWEKNCYAFHFSAAEQVGRIAAQRDFGWIYQRLSVCNYSGVVLSRKLGKPLVLEYNGSEAWIAKNWGRPLRRQDLAERIEEANLKHAHLIVTISDVLKDELLARGIPRERIVVYPNCFDPNAFDPQRFSRGDVAALRQRYGIADDAMVVTFLGTFGQWHGAAVLAAAARQILDANADWVRERKLHFMFVGDGVKMPDVRAALGPHASGGNVTLTGLVAQAQAPMYLAASDVLASPHVANADGSRFFGSPTKLFEYMAMEKAILASDLDQIGEVLTPGLAVSALPRDDTAPDEDKVALLTVPGSAEEIAAGIAFLARRPDWRRSLAAAARRRALAKYTWRHHVTAIVDQAKDLGLVERLASSDQGGGSAG